jgi:ferredoxin-type protein NapG
MNDGLLNSRTPKLDFHKGYCDFCVDANDGKPLCRANCPTGALGSFDPDTEWIGAAVLDTELCLAYGVARSCMRCIEGCPFDAIVADEYGRPVVDTEKCNGCGYCEFICPSNTYRTYSGSTKRAIVVEPSEISRTEFVEGNPIEAKGGQA